MLTLITWTVCYIIEQLSNAKDKYTSFPRLKTKKKTGLTTVSHI